MFSIFYKCIFLSKSRVLKLPVAVWTFPADSCCCFLWHCIVCCCRSRCRRVKKKTKTHRQCTTPSILLHLPLSVCLCVCVCVLLQRLCSGLMCCILEGADFSLSCFCIINQRQPHKKEVAPSRSSHCCFNYSPAPRLANCFSSILSTHNFCCYPCSLFQLPLAKELC